MSCTVQSSSNWHQLSVLEATATCSNLSRSYTQFLGFHTIDQHGRMNEETSNEMMISMKEFISWAATSDLHPVAVLSAALAEKVAAGTSRERSWWRSSSPRAGRRHSSSESSRSRSRGGSARVGNRCAGHLGAWLYVLEALLGASATRGVDRRAGRGLAPPMVPKFIWNI